MNYRETLNLPQDVLPMRANLPHREPEFQRQWEEREIYRKSLERENRGLWVLHDGPPYSNGDIHMGHALNKILKDVISRHRSMQGYRSPYVPGWDNHGLPIEHAVTEAARAKGERLGRVELRRRCREYAGKWVEVQREQFKRLGVRGDWEHPYLTMAPDFEARIVEVFAELALNGFVYRGLKPILWCPYDETALAEAEVEYDEKTSPSIYVRFPVQSPGSSEQAAPNTEHRTPNTEHPTPNAQRPTPHAQRLFALIWTTTPWTIPANLALAFHPDFDYVTARVGDADYLVAEALLPAVMKACGIAEWEVVGKQKGSELEGTIFRHPLAELDPVFDRPSPAVLADYVTLEQGTGIVHTAPGHGEDDFRTGQKYGLEVLNPVDEQGRFTAEAGPFQGKAIRPGEADKAVLQALRESGNLLHQEPYRHNYPHCWRCHGPLIFRTTVQWFMDVDQEVGPAQTLRTRMLEQIGQTQWVPAESVNRIEAMAGGRPDWCLSRQRVWGVGIPIFYCGGCSEPITARQSLDAAIALVREQGADAWFSVPAEEILPHGFACPHCGHTGSFRKETDVLDVWFDSGSTWRAVLLERPDLHYPAEVYIEGSDQHRGWFNSSLTVSTALRGIAPFKTVISCGFVMDPNGEKMSKSRGNVTDPLVEIQKSGADLLRLWVASTDYFDDLRVGDAILEHVRNVFMRIRNTLRFLVGNLADFDPERDWVEEADREEIDRWALHRLHEVLSACGAAYEAYVYHEVFHQVQNFCAVDLGAFYLDVIKDRLYCSRADDPARRSGQSTLYQIADHLARALAPILVHVSEEVYQVIPGRAAQYESVHLAPFPDAHDLWRDEELAENWRRLREVRDRVNAAIEPLKPKAKSDPDFVLKSSLEAAVTLTAGPDWSPLLERYRDQLAAVFMVPVARVEARPEPGLEVRVERQPGPRCERCWLVLPTVGQDAAHADLCERCSAVVG